MRLKLEIFIGLVNNISLQIHSRKYLLSLNVTYTNVQYIDLLIQSMIGKCNATIKRDTNPLPITFITSSLNPLKHPLA